MSSTTGICDIRPDTMDDGEAALHVDFAGRHQMRIPLRDAKRLAEAMLACVAELGGVPEETPPRRHLQSVPAPHGASNSVREGDPK